MLLQHILLVLFTACPITTSTASPITIATSTASISNSIAIATRASTASSTAITYRYAAIATATACPIYHDGACKCKKCVMVMVAWWCIMMPENS